jgi:hypothetical protein
MLSAAWVAAAANVDRFIFTIQPRRNSTEPMRAAGTPPPAVDKVAFVFSGVDTCNCIADGAVHWFSSSSAISSTSWRMASAPLMRTAKARRAAAIWSCTIRDPAQLLASIIACAAGEVGQSLVPPLSEDGAGPPVRGGWCQSRFAFGEQSCASWR